MSCAYIDMLYDPAMIEFCQRCRLPDCPGICDSYKNEYRRRNGMAELPAYHLRGYQRNSTDEQRRHVIEYQGESHTLAEWARIKGIDYGTLYMRLKRAGSTPESILSESITNIIPKVPMMIEVNGESHTVREWSEINQIPLKCVQSRIRAGWDLRDAVTIPSGGKLK